MFGDADAGTHVATGLWILEHRHIPVTDPFSGTRAGAEWFAHEWLADVASALAYRVAGCAGLLAASAIVISLAHVVLFRFLVRRGGGGPAAPRAGGGGPAAGPPPPPGAAPPPPPAVPRPP